MARQSNEELTVHGIKVDSINEKYVALALEKLGLEFAYQYYSGGAGLRGSQIIDFLVYTDPKPTPLYVHGDYWHGGQYAQETELKESLINSKMRGTWNMAVVIWEHECETEEQAYNAVRTKLAV
jgi:hypothetical protein